MTEHTLAFGPNNGLVGTICLPSPSQTSGIGVILFNAGVVHRIGPHRINVRLARKLAAKGIASIRFDLSGQGDSARSLKQNSFETQVEMDIGEAIQALGAATGLKQFALFGFCSGAYHGFAIANAEKRLSGLLMFDAFIFPTLKSRINRYVMRIKQHGFVKAIGGFAFREIAVLRNWLMSGKEDSGKSNPAPDERYFTKFPTKPEFAKGVRILLDQNVKVGLIFTGGGFEHYNYAGQFRDAIAKFDFGDSITTEYFPDMDHVATGIAGQSKLIQYIEEWMVDLNKV